MKYLTLITLLIAADLAAHSIEVRTPTYRVTGTNCSESSGLIFDEAGLGRGKASVRSCETHLVDFPPPQPGTVGAITVDIFDSTWLLWFECGLSSMSWDQGAVHYQFYCLDDPIFGARWLR